MELSIGRPVSEGVDELGSTPGGPDAGEDEWLVGDDVTGTAAGRDGPSFTCVPALLDAPSVATGAAGFVTRTDGLVSREAVTGVLSELGSVESPAELGVGIATEADVGCATGEGSTAGGGVPSSALTTDATLRQRRAAATPARASFITR
jgi:hypothetical protein